MVGQSISKETLEIKELAEVKKYERNLQFFFINFANY